MPWSKDAATGVGMIVPGPTLSRRRGFGDQTEHIAVETRGAIQIGYAEGDKADARFHQLPAFFLARCSIPDNVMRLHERCIRRSSRLRWTEHCA
jgi:hypothetical protein